MVERSRKWLPNPAQLRENVARSGHRALAMELHLNSLRARDSAVNAAASASNLRQAQSQPKAKTVCRMPELITPNEYAQEAWMLAILVRKTFLRDSPFLGV